MTTRHFSEILAARAEIVAPPAPRACQDHSFDLPPALHIATGGMFLAFIAILSLAFMSPIMAIVFGVCVAFLTAFFAVPAIFVKTSPKDHRALRWAEFVDNGVDTATGRTGAGEATTLVLLLPFLMVCWAIAVVTIAALV